MTSTAPRLNKDQRAWLPRRESLEEGNGLQMTLLRQRRGSSGGHLPNDGSVIVKPTRPPPRIVHRLACRRVGVPELPPIQPSHPTTSPPPVNPGRGLLHFRRPSHAFALMDEPHRGGRTSAHLGPSIGSPKTHTELHRPSRPLLSRGTRRALVQPPDNAPAETEASCGQRDAASRSYPQPVPGRPPEAACRAAYSMSS